MDFNKIVEDLSTSIVGACHGMINAARFDRTFRAVIVAVSGNTYTVQIKGKQYNIKERAQYAVDDWVWVCVPCNNWNNMFIVK